MRKMQKFEWIEWDGCMVSHGDESDPNLTSLSQGPEMIIRMKTSDGIFFLKPSHTKTVDIRGDIAEYNTSIEFTS